MPDEAPFLGQGWSFPPAFSRGGAEVETVAGIEDVHQSLRILLSTLPGERVMQESFGCDLESVLFEEVDQGLINTVTRLVTNAILDHEPRIELDRIDVEETVASAGGRALRLAIHYTILGTNSRFNMVFPFYLDEAVTPGL